MTLLETLVRTEHALRPLLSSLPPMLATRLFSRGRTAVSDWIVRDRPRHRTISTPPVQAWGLQFQTPLWNAAGMFKNGHGYQMVQRQGAGAYVAGTTTSRPRSGNTKYGVKWPAVAYAHSQSASNWMGLPNDGHDAVAKRLSVVERIPGCPIGASVSAQPELDPSTALQELIDGLHTYAAAGVDYLELNESCPNVEGHGGGPVLDEGLIQRLEAIREQFLKRRSRPLPVVVKFSVDTSADQLPELISTLVEMDFDGVILGNTSTQYAKHRSSIAPPDRPLYDLFTESFGGGLSGGIVRESALQLAASAVKIVRELNPRQEFHVIRCGGIGTVADLEASAQAGVILNQWYTGYYEAFAEVGHDLYQKITSRA